MAKAPLPPTPVLKLLPSGCQIILLANNDISLCILQGLMQTRAHILPTGRWANLEQLLWESKPPTLGPFHNSFRQYAKNMHPRKGIWQSTMVTVSNGMQWGG